MTDISITRDTLKHVDSQVAFPNTDTVDTDWGQEQALPVADMLVCQAHWAGKITSEPLPSSDIFWSLIRMDFPITSYKALV